jgi:uncharacterized membrane protein
VLVGSVLLAAGLVAYLPRPKEEATASVDAANGPLQPTSREPLQQPVEASQEDGNAASAEPGGKAKASPTEPDESPGVAADQQKGMADEGPAGVLGDAQPKSQLVGVPDGPQPGVVVDTPQGLYAARTQAKTAEWLAERGGTIESQKAVEDGLNWLARHQGDGGHWGPDCLGKEPHSRCDQKAPCDEPGHAYDVAHSGLALLAFQAAGHYHFNGQKYSDNVTKGLDYLVQMQAPDGSIVGPKNPTPEQVTGGAPFERNFMYEHAMATFALCEACAVAIAEGKEPDPRYQKAAASAVSFIEKIQHDDGGWRYSVDAHEASDCSVSGWVMLALKTAREAKVDVSPQTISRMMDFFAAHYMDDRKEVAKVPIIWDWNSQVLRTYHGTYYVDYRQLGGPIQVTSDAMTGVGMMAVEFFDHKLDSPIVQWGAPYLAEKAGALTVMNPSTSPGPGGVIVDKSGPTDVVTPIGGYKDVAAPLGGYYAWYNCTMAMFQVGGEPWKRWNGVIRDHVVSLQVQGEGCDRGSWLSKEPWADQGGRIYSTALAVLTLEVYYRFQRVAGQPEKEKFFEK